MDIVVSFAKSRSSPVNKSDGFMPIRDGSIATDYNQAPRGQNPFAKSNLDSDRTNLHPSPEVNLSASTSTTLSSYQHEPAGPSKFKMSILETEVSVITYNYI